ncbi:T9SS type A sorting domain-containing protein, partial [Bacteroidota bacterium]
HLTGTAGILDLNVIEDDMRIYPNPMQGQAELSFYAKKSGNAQLIIYDISGKGVLQISNAFFQGIQMCHITGLKQGIYFVNIIGENYLYTAKLISLNTAQSEAKIEIVGIEKTEDAAPQLQRTKSISNMSYTIGDSLRFKGYSGVYSSIITDVPTSSKTITFIFTSIPTITTDSITSITTVAATSGGNITNDGGATVTARGLCWSTTTNPVATGNHTTDGSGIGTFTSNITGLTAGTVYYVRAYATNSVGTAYGNELTFTTAIPITVPVLSTTTVSSITATTANSGGNITSDGGATVTARGLCWSTTTNPVATGNHTTDGTGTGTFTSNITGLTASTVYYVRAYATNSVGTAYGNQLFFTTDSSTTSFTCGDTLNINHTIGAVAPITKSVAYGTVTTNLSGASKCWITQNLGSSNQAYSATDATDAAAGWYWQFNRKQGYKNGTSPIPAWTITSINETSDWLAVDDPCTIELGTGWRIPTKTEWTNVDANGAWSNYTHAYNSVLKLHAGGWLYNSTGALYHRGGGGRFWSSTQNNAINGWYLIFSNSLSSINNYSKAGAFAVRCIKD